MSRFAHISDVHLGFQKEPNLQEIEKKTFSKFIDYCITNHVDFVLMVGDIFHTNIPSMDVQKFALLQFKRLYDHKINVYGVYGNHDFSPSHNSFIDLLSAIDYFTKVTKSTINSNGVNLEFFTDEKTGAKLAGLSGLTGGRDIDVYKELHLEPLVSEPGFKIFLFHAAVTEMKSQKEIPDSMPISYMPRGFDYYAGGHLHDFKIESGLEGYPNVMYSGTLFAGQQKDLENNARGTSRRFVVVDFDEQINSIVPVEMPNVEYEFIRYDANGKKPSTVNMDIKKETDEISPRDKIILIKVRGELLSGKTSDVESSGIHESLKSAGALSVHFSKSGLSSKDYSITPANGETISEIEENIISENIGQMRLDTQYLLGDSGTGIAKDLIKSLASQSHPNESKSDYTDRIKNDALKILKLEPTQ